MTMFDIASETFGTLLRQFRKRQHLTQQQLAKALGLHRNTIGRWEEGSFLPESKTLILELARCLHLTELEARRLLDASFLAPIPVWSVPYPRNPFFTGRENLLATLHTHLAPGHSIALPRSYALHGMGGIGKTQLALEYAYRYALAYRAIFWIEAETLEQIHACLLHIARRLDLLERLEADHQRVVSAVQRWLESHSEWLLIWDNLEDLDLFQRFLPALRHGAILLTTRQQALGTLAHGIDLTPMEAEEGMLFLFRRAKILENTASVEQVRELAVNRPDEHAAAQELVTELGGLPLALDQVGAYIEETRGRLPDCLALFRQAPLRLLQERGAHVEHPASVVTTFVQAFERLQQRYPAAAQLLTACCFLAPEEIPECLFTQHTFLLPSLLQHALGEPFAFQELAKKLLAYALIQRQPDRQTLVVHRLVQAVLREKMERQEQLEWRKRMIRVLNAAFPEVTHEVWEACERLLPHVLACVAHLPDQEVDREILAEVLRKAADYLHERAHYEQAERLYQRNFCLVEHARGSEDLSVASPAPSSRVPLLGAGQLREGGITV